MVKYKIGQVTKMYGISHDQLRYYHKINLLKPTTNPENGYRYYRPEDLNKLSYILLAKELGIQLSTAHQLIGTVQTSQVIHILQEHLADLEVQLQKLENLKTRTNQIISELDPFTKEVFNQEHPQFPLNLTLHQISEEELVALLGTEESFLAYLDFQYWKDFSSNTEEGVVYFSSSLFANKSCELEIEGNFYQKKFSGTREELLSSITNLKKEGMSNILVQYIAELLNKEQTNILAYIYYKM